MRKKMVMRVLAVFALIVFSSGVAFASPYERPVSQSKPTQRYEPITLSPITTTQTDETSTHRALSATDASIVAAGGVHPVPTIEYLDPRTLLWSHDIVTDKAVQYRDAMRAGIWDWTATDGRQVIHAVRTNHGIVLIDNSRAAAALDLGIERIPVLVHNDAELLSIMDNPIFENGDRRF